MFIDRDAIRLDRLRRNSAVRLGAEPQNSYGAVQDFMHAPNYKHCTPTEFCSRALAIDSLAALCRSPESTQGQLKPSVSIDAAQPYDRLPACRCGLTNLRPRNPIRFTPPSRRRHRRRRSRNFERGWARDAVEVLATRCKSRVAAARGCFTPSLQMHTQREQPNPARRKPAVGSHSA
jgi:hypothetical protein